MRQLRTFEYIAEEEPAARRVHVRKKTVPELAYTLAERRANRKLTATGLADTYVAYSFREPTPWNWSGRY